ncbi:hypothetical protein BRARA_C02435 [Brassica rapa]|uniref:Uncharacterized protein n=1 Tax=Brassica campestris TaxID=3711 RepID=A0A397ZXY1_BRACM|nr:hypothetical protein BRARA_C02435 [Brassica rapa]
MRSTQINHNIPTEEAPLATILLLSLSLSSTVNSFFSDQIQSKSALRERSILVLRLCGRACVAGEAKLPSDPIAEGEPNRSERNRDRSYYVLVYHRIAEQKVIKCVLLSQRGNHSKIHHTKEDSGCGECSTESQRKPHEDSVYTNNFWQQIFK